MDWVALFCDIDDFVILTTSAKSLNLSFNVVYCLDRRGRASGPADFR